jgi:predicted CoA-binding protein
VEIVRDAVGAGVPRVWMQPGSESDAAIAAAHEAGAEIVTGQCMFLHLEPVRGIHAVHRFIARLFGKV